MKPHFPIHNFSQLRSADYMLQCKVRNQSWPAKDSAKLWNTQPKNLPKLCKQTLASFSAPQGSRTKTTHLAACCSFPYFQLLLCLIITLCHSTGTVQGAKGRGWQESQRQAKHRNCLSRTPNHNHKRNVGAGELPWEALGLKCGR